MRVAMPWLERPYLPLAGAGLSIAGLSSKAGPDCKLRCDRLRNCLIAVERHLRHSKTLQFGNV